jgi:GTP-binding protein
LTIDNASDHFADVSKMVGVGLCKDFRNFACGYRRKSFVMSIVAIVGRPNVGKSTLFNRLVGMRQAIVDEVAGVTRDRHYGRSDWNGREFSVIDTGGYAVNTDDVFEEEIRKQVLLAIDEADLILFMVDVTTGITDFDATMADVLRRSKKPVLPVVNKVDNLERSYSIHEFYSLGLGEPWAVSSISGSGTGDLMDEIIKHLPDDKMPEEEKQLPHIAIVGKPNVGKSSLTNALLGEERHIVTPVAGTTRDAVSAYYNKFGYEFMLVDTAGLRKKTKVKENLEFYSVMRSVRAIENADVCVLMIDATQGVEAQDMSIFNLIYRNKKGCVVVVNKWDLVEKSTNTMKEYREIILERLAPFTDVPVVFTSVTGKQRIFDVLQTAAKVYENRMRRIPTSQLNEAMLQEIENYPPPSIKGKYIRIKYVAQLPTPSPSFAFFCNLPQYVREDYKRFLENKLRQHFEFTGCPLQLFMRKK